MSITPMQIFVLRVLGTLAATQFGPKAKRYFDMLASLAQANVNIEAYMAPVADAMEANSPIDWTSAIAELKAESDKLQGK